MSLRFQPLKPIPPRTVEVAKAALGESNIVMKLRDELGTLYRDSDFTKLFSHEGQPGVSPGAFSNGLCTTVFGELI